MHTVTTCGPPEGLQEEIKAHNSLPFFKTKGCLVLVLVVFASFLLMSSKISTHLKFSLFDGSVKLELDTMLVGEHAYSYL